MNPKIACGARKIRLFTSSSLFILDMLGSDINLFTLVQKRSYRCIWVIIPKGFVDRSFLGNLEWWNAGILGFLKGTNLPLFQYSIIPASFWQNVNAVFILACHAKSILDTNEIYYFRTTRYFLRKSTGL
jgi:hypothetical protein